MDVFRYDRLAMEMAPWSAAAAAAGAGWDRAVLNAVLTPVYGFYRTVWWSGDGDADICFSLTRVPPHFWQAHPDTCADIVAKDAARFTHVFWYSLYAYAVGRIVQKFF